MNIIDKNKDGKIDFDEFLVSIRVCYFEFVLFRIRVMSMLQDKL